MAMEGALIMSVLMLNVLILHVRLNKTDIEVGLEAFRRCFRRSGYMSLREQQKQHRQEEEVLKMRLHLFTQVSRVTVHFSMIAIMAFLVNFYRSPGVVSGLLLIPSLLGYTSDTMTNFGLLKVTSKRQWRRMEVFFLAIHVIFAIGVNRINEVWEFFVMEKLASVIFLPIAFVSLDYKVTVPIYACEAVIQVLKQMELSKSEALHRPMTLFASITSHLMVIGAIVIVENLIRSKIASSLDSDHAASLVSAFRRLLGGVSDGDLVLDSNCKMLDDASCLEKLLMSERKLVDSSFLDLISDASRQRFLQFIQTENVRGGIAQGLRVALQGRNGLVSVDVFQVPLRCIDGQTHRMLSIKVDHESTMVPEASPCSVPAVSSFGQDDFGSFEPQGDTDVLRAYDELVDVVLLLNSRPGLDIEEARLKFRRRSEQASLQLGMPTLQRLIPPEDWSFVEGSFKSILRRHKQQRRSSSEKPWYLQKPIVFCLPGGSSRYFRADTASVSIAEKMESNPTHFWMKLTGFESGCRPALTGILEEH